MSGFKTAQRFETEVAERKLRPAYVFIGDEAFFRKRCREAILKYLAPPEVRDFSLYEMDLMEVDINEVLDRARTPSLMAPFQVFFVRGVKSLYGRGKHEEEFAAIEAYCKSPNPDALIILIADHISIPADVRRLSLTCKAAHTQVRGTQASY